jgi:hypothetical protein
MSVGLLGDFPTLELPVDHFMSCKHTALHQFILFQVHCTCGALDVKRSLANVPIISLYVFEKIKKMSQAIAKISNAVIQTRKRSVDLDQITLYNINPKLVTKTAFPSKLVRGKWVALLSRALLKNSTVCSVNRQQAVVKTATPLPILNYNLAENICSQYFFALINCTFEQTVQTHTTSGSISETA